MRSFFLFFLVVSTLPGHAHAVCAKVSARGADCAGLKVTWDLSACSDPGEATPTRVRCVGDEALVGTDKGAVEFRARFSPHDRGADAEWTLVELTRTKVLSRHRPMEAKAPLVETKPESEPEPPSALPPSGPSPKPPATTQKIARTPPLMKRLETAAQRDEFLGFHLGVNLDAYYQYNFNEPGPLNVSEPVGVLPAGNTETRFYDAYHNQISLNLAQLEISRATDEVGFLLDLDFGLQADLNSRDEVGKHVGRAFVTYHPKWLPRLRVRAGKFFSHVGLETIRSRDNWNYSRSTTFGFGSPFWHMGLGVETELSPQLSVSGYVYNGTTTAFYENNGGKSYGFRLEGKPAKDLVVQYNFLTGPERAASPDARTTHEFNVTYGDERLSAALELLTAIEKGTPAGDSRWHGAFLVAKAKCASGFSISPRFEWFRDETGFATGRSRSYSLYSGTLTFAQTLSEDLEARLELRLDHANVSVFSRHGGIPARDQGTATFALLFTL